MTEILHNLLHPLPNAVMTVIMVILVLYWVFVLISGAGLEDLDFGFDFDVPDIDTPDIDTDIDIDGDVNPSGIDTPDFNHDVSVGKEPGLFIQCLSFLNIGKVPFMVIMTTLNFFMWIGTLITTSVITLPFQGVSSLIILIPIGIFSLLSTKYVTNPMAKFFEEIGYKGEKEINFFGCAGKMLSNIKEEKIGTAEFLIDKNTIKLNVRSFDGQELKYGDHIIIIEESDDKKIYYVSK